MRLNQYSAYHHIAIMLTKKSGPNFHPFENSYSFAGLAYDQRTIQSLVNRGFLTESGSWRTPEYSLQLGPDIVDYPFVNYLERGIAMDKVHGADIDLAMALAWCAEQNVLIQFTASHVQVTKGTHTVISPTFLQAVYELQGYLEFANSRVAQ